MNFKIIFFVLAIFAFLLSILSSCTKDDPDPIPETHELVGKYQTDKLVLNGVAAAPLVMVDIKQISGTSNIALVLSNVVVGDSDLELLKVDVDKTATGYDLLSTDENAERLVTFKASVVEKVMTVNIEVKIKSNLVGLWTLKRWINSQSFPQADVIFSIASGREDQDSQELDAMLNSFITPIVGQKLGAAVEVVDADFKENGALSISYVEIKDGIAGSVSTVPVPLNYYTKENRVYIAVDKDLIDTLIPQLIPEGLSLSWDDLKALFVDAGTHYSLPLNVKKEGDYTEFFVDESLISRLIPIAAKFLPEDGAIGYTKEELEQMTKHIETSKSIKLGLGFNKKVVAGK